MRVRDFWYYIRVPSLEKIIQRFLEKVASSPACVVEVPPNRRRFDSEYI